MFGQMGRVEELDQVFREIQLFGRNLGARDPRESEITLGFLKLCPSPLL